MSIHPDVYSWTGLDKLNAFLVRRHGELDRLARMASELPGVTVDWPAVQAEINAVINEPLQGLAESRPEGLPEDVLGVTADTGHHVKLGSEVEIADGAVKWQALMIVEDSAELTPEALRRFGEARAVE